MHTGTLHDTCQVREMALFCFPVPPLLQDGLVRFLTVETDDHRRFFFLHLSFIFTLSYFCTFPLSLALLRLSFIRHASVLIPSSFLHLALRCFWSLFCSLSLLFVFQAFPSFLAAELLLWDYPRSFDIKISSPQCCPVFPSSRPCNIKVRGDTLAVFSESLFAAEEKRPGAGVRKTMSPTAEPAR